MKMLFVMAGVAALPVLAAQEDATVFSIRSDRGYPQPEKRLQELVAARGRHALNHFCVIGYRYPGGEQNAWAYWKEGNAIVLWEQSADPRHPLSLAVSRRFLRLDRDVVASSAQLHGSTYLVTRAWVTRIMDDCEKRGEKFMVHKSRRS